jgi:hypothetical protein
MAAETDSALAPEIHSQTPIKYVPRAEGMSPEAYAVEVDGSCLEPILMHGEAIIVEPVWPHCGDIGVMFLNGRPDGIVKRMTMAVYGIPCHPDSEVMPIIAFEQINPPKRYTMLGDRFARIHRATMVLRGDKWLPIDPKVRP